MRAVLKANEAFKQRARAAQAVVPAEGGADVPLWASSGRTPFVGKHSRREGGRGVGVWSVGDSDEDPCVACLGCRAYRTRGRWTSVTAMSDDSTRFTGLCLYACRALETRVVLVARRREEETSSN